MVPDRPGEERDLSTDNWLATGAQTLLQETYTCTRCTQIDVLYQVAKLQEVVKRLHSIKGAKSEDRWFQHHVLVTGNTKHELS